MSEKIRTICVDTLTGIQNEMYMTSSKKANHDKWKDYGQDIWKLISYFQEKGFEIILILGEPGTGKSTGMRNLPSQTNIWFNADNKNPVWTGGKAEYGKKFNPTMPYHLIPKTYKDIRDHIDEVASRDMFEDEKFAILTGHVEDYKTGADMKKRLKTLGNMATNMQIEGKLETVLYSDVIKEEGNTRYILYTENSGANTGRSPMGAFDAVIDNDYQFLVERLMEV
jgi:hypothetical protein|tara:strand:+ start:37162 stop:37836 length:675 start_codon:yes stop_codon:yes gene_type:complete